MISRRALEMATAALTGIFGVAVVVSSIDNGIGWSSVAAARRARRRVRFLKGRAMENLQSLLHGFTIAVTVPHLTLMVIGVLLGILVGVLPGLGAPNGVSLLLPLTFGMQPVSAIILLSSMYWGALFGGSVTSILFNIPGEPSSVATTFDGYPMARDGRPTTALATAFGSAAFGALVGVILITFLASWVAQVALAFGPPEYFAVYFLAFASFVGMGGSPPIKTLVSLAIGFALAAVGIDTVSGSVRLTMGIDELVKGVRFVVAVMGLFGLGGLMIWGLNPGPMLFIEQKDFVWGLIASMYLGNVVAVILVLLTVPVFAALMRVPFFIIAPLIVIICTVGAYSVSNSYLDVVLMMGFGVLGYLFKKLHYPLEIGRAHV